MDEYERLAYKYLLNHFSVVKYEPLGQSAPPDFICDDEVVVEVRKLNETKDNSSGRHGLESDAIKLDQIMGSVLAELGAASGQSSWYVSWKFNRPLSKTKIIKQEIKRKLKGLPEDFNGGDEDPIYIGENLQLYLSRAGNVHEDIFIPAGSLDLDSGGWLHANLIENIQKCIDEKTKKIKGIRSYKNVMWLVLVDCISGPIPLGVHDFKFIGKYIQKSDVWNKVIIINPCHESRVYEL